MITTTLFCSVIMITTSFLLSPLQAHVSRVTNRIWPNKSWQRETSCILAALLSGFFAWQCCFPALASSNGRANVSQHARARHHCAETKLLTVAGWLPWQTLNKPLHCWPSLLRFYPESPPLLSGKLYCSNLCWRHRGGGAVSGAHRT